MSEEKPKNDERQVEWSFDFAQLNDSFKKLVDSISGDEEVLTSNFQVQKQEARSLELHVEIGLGTGNISALSSESPLLLESTIKHIGEVELTDNSDTDRKVRIQQKGKVSDAGKTIKRSLRALADRDDLEWNLQIAPDVPLFLELEGGVGPVKANLNGLTVRKIDADGGVGSVTLILPSQSEKIEVSVDGGVGETHIYIPENADVSLKIDGGVGTVEVVVAPNSAVQLRAEGGIGAIHTPASLKRMSKKEFLEAGGMWQSEGYDLAEKRINIKYEGGIGAFNLREAELI